MVFYLPPFSKDVVLYCQSGNFKELFLFFAMANFDLMIHVEYSRNLQIQCRLLSEI